MLIHLRPRLLGPLGRYWASLTRFEVPEIGVALAGYRHGEIAVHHPYPNKAYTVGCRATARKAEDGFVFETSAGIKRFTSIAEWRVSMGDKAWTLLHQVNYVVLDQEYDALTDDMTLWGKAFGWPDRWPQTVQGPPASAAPRAEIFETGTHVGDVRFRLHEAGANVVTGAVAGQVHTFYMPTVERGRLGSFGMLKSRFPSEIVG
jgi:hypothetical protein